MPSGWMRHAGRRMADPQAPLLSVRGGRTAKLRDIDLDLKAGEVLGIGGLQGSGRSSLARAISGAEPFVAGAVTLHGAPVRIRSPRQAGRRSASCCPAAVPVAPRTSAY